jgi:hypothetical protein
VSFQHEITSGTWPAPQVEGKDTGKMPDQSSASPLANLFVQALLIRVGQVRWGLALSVGDQLGDAVNLAGIQAADRCRARRGLQSCGPG